MPSLCLSLSNWVVLLELQVPKPYHQVDLPPVYTCALTALPFNLYTHRAVPQALSLSGLHLPFEYLLVWKALFLPPLSLPRHVFWESDTLWKCQMKTGNGCCAHTAFSGSDPGYTERNCESHKYKRKSSNFSSVPSIKCKLGFKRECGLLLTFGLRTKLASLNGRLCVVKLCSPDKFIFAFSLEI